MGTASTKKFIKNSAGQLAEEQALVTSAGTADAHRIPALNADGILDDTILNASAVKAASKVVKTRADGVIDPTVVNAKAVSAGAADKEKIVMLDTTGRIDPSMMPVGYADEVSIVTASEALAAGDFVNIWSDAGVAKVRKADATAAGKEAQGFVLESVALAGQAHVYFEGANTQVSGQVPGAAYLSATAPGKSTNAIPTAAGHIVQRIGFAVSATEVNFQSNQSILLS